MRVRLRYAALLALPALAHAVSLSEFTPRAHDLPPACEAIYNEQIPGCGVKDFGNFHCTHACIRSLEELVFPIKKACGGLGLRGKNLIVAFLDNIGPQQICHNAPVDPSPPGPPNHSPPGGWGSSSSSSQPPHHGGWGHHTTSSSQKWSGTSTASSLAPGDSSSLLVDTTSKPHHAPIPPKTTSHSHTRTITPTKSRSGPSQLNTGDHSGGGSPFDTAGNLGNSAAGLSFSAAVALMSTLGALLVLR